MKIGQKIQITASHYELIRTGIPADIAEVITHYPVQLITDVADDGSIQTTHSAQYWIYPNRYLPLDSEPLAPVSVYKLPVGAAQFHAGAGQTITPATERQIVLTPRMALTQDFIYQVLSLREQLKKNFLGLPLEGLDKISDALAEKLTRAIITEHQPKKS